MLVHSFFCINFLGYFNMHQRLRPFFALRPLSRNYKQERVKDPPKHALIWIVRRLLLQTLKAETATAQYSLFFKSTWSTITELSFLSLWSLRSVICLPVISEMMAGIKFWKLCLH